jgi:hypothetical protein
MSPMLLRLVPFVSGAGALTIAGLGIALFLTRGELDSVRKDLTIANALRDRDAATFKAGQAIATADHLQDIIRLKDLNRSLKDEADNQAERMRADFDARVLRLPSVPAGAAYFGGDQQAAVPADGLSASPDRPGADRVLLTRGDAQICADVTRRLVVGHDWAVTPRDQDKVTSSSQSGR